MDLVDLGSSTADNANRAVSLEAMRSFIFIVHDLNADNSAGG